MQILRQDYAANLRRRSSVSESVTQADVRPSVPRHCPSSCAGSGWSRDAQLPDRRGENPRRGRVSKQEGGLSGAEHAQGEGLWGRGGGGGLCSRRPGEYRRGEHAVLCAVPKGQLHLRKRRPPGRGHWNGRQAARALTGYCEPLATLHGGFLPCNVEISDRGDFRREISDRGDFRREIFDRAALDSDDTRPAALRSSGSRSRAAVTAHRRNL